METVPEIIWSMQSRLWNYAGLRDERRPFRVELISNWTFRDEIISNQIATKIRQEVQQMWREQLGKVSVWNFDVLLDRKMRKMSGITFFGSKNALSLSLVSQIARSLGKQRRIQTTDRMSNAMVERFVCNVENCAFFSFRNSYSGAENCILGIWNATFLGISHCCLKIQVGCNLALFSTYDGLLFPWVHVIILLAAFMLLYLVPFNNTRISMIVILSKF